MHSLPCTPNKLIRFLCRPCGQVPAHVLASATLADIDGDGTDELLIPVSYYFDREALSAPEHWSAPPPLPAFPLLSPFNHRPTGKHGMCEAVWGASANATAFKSRCGRGTGASLIRAPLPPSLLPLLQLPRGELPSDVDPSHYVAGGLLAVTLDALPASRNVSPAMLARGQRPLLTPYIKWSQRPRRLRE